MHRGSERAGCIDRRICASEYYVGEVTNVVFSADATDLRNDVLTALCRDTFAVSLVDQSGQRFGAVLVSHNGITLVYERWNVGEAAYRRTDDHRLSGPCRDLRLLNSRPSIVEELPLLWTSCFEKQMCDFVYQPLSSELRRELGAFAGRADLVLA